MKSASEATPTPSSDTVCGVPAELSEISSKADKLLADFGEKTTEIPQLAFVANEPPQVFVSVNELAPEPVIEMDTIASALSPMFERVIVCCAEEELTTTLPKESFDTDTTAIGPPELALELRKAPASTAPDCGRGVPARSYRIPASASPAPMAGLPATSR